jgi:hypothetical protein
MLLELIRRVLQARTHSRRLETVPDRVWISSSAKLNGIRLELDQLSARGASLVALVAHFPDTLHALEEVAANYHGSRSVRAVLARHLSTEAAGSLPATESDVVELVVAERHPLASKDVDLIRFAEALPCQCRIVHHLSLDDPLLLWFGTESVRALLDRLGTTADEPITHPLITLSIKRAQEKIAAEVVGPHDADSAGAWLERNVRR